MEAQGDRIWPEFWRAWVTSGRAQLLAQGTWPRPALTRGHPHTQPQGRQRAHPCLGHPRALPHGPPQTSQEKGSPSLTPACLGHGSQTGSAALLPYPKELRLRAEPLSCPAVWPWPLLAFHTQVHDSRLAANIKPSGSLLVSPPSSPLSGLCLDL